ncbi:MAG: peptide-methionine (S)-S-oxide reductase MsrA [Gaiellaceae bacterium]|jgi:methionine-S-sulfoxide reductase
MATTEKAIFAAGCFWGVEAYFKRVGGVVATAAGYSGGTTAQPSYEEVCTGRTGHAESVLVEYDPTVVSYERLLYHFWKIHDPTQRDRQGNDVGTQYRSAIFTFSKEQQESAERSRAELEQSGRYSQPLATEIAAARDFWPAEPYHQDYLDKHPGGYCHVDLSNVD